MIRLSVARCLSNASILQQQQQQIFMRQTRLCSADRSSYAYRTHTCGELTSAHLGEKVTLCGWFFKSYIDGTLHVRDATGMTRFKLAEWPRDVEVKKMLGAETVIQVNGEVTLRHEDCESPEIKTGQIQVLTHEVPTILNPTLKHIPFAFKNLHRIKLRNVQQHWFYYLRSERMQHNLRLRSEVTMKMREFLCRRHGFVDVETPCLVRTVPSTGGSRDREYVVATHEKDRYYTLPRSPQQFKQLLMTGGIDRYMQVAKCFRNEGQERRPDWQPEISQFDLEMSFVEREGLMNVVEDLVNHIWPDSLGEAPGKFPRMTYKEAIAQYGTDKPDLRFAPIVEVTDIMIESEFKRIVKKLVRGPGNGAYALVYKKGSRKLSNKVRKTLQNSEDGFRDCNLFVQKVKYTGVWSGQLDKFMNKESVERMVERFNLEPDDLICIAFGRTSSCLKMLSAVKEKIFTLLYQWDRTNPLRRITDIKFTWVTDFPLFRAREKKDTRPGLLTVNHPYTAPLPEDEDKVYSEDPTEAIGQQISLVVNGLEVGTGSVNIIDSALQKHVLEGILKHEDLSAFQHVLNALDSGCPPHGGFHFYLENLMATICREEILPYVITFPKNEKGLDLMCRSPGFVPEEIRDYYNLLIGPQIPPKGRPITPIPAMTIL